MLSKMWNGGRKVVEAIPASLLAAISPPLTLRYGTPASDDGGAR